jgi:hypothetical protein
MMHYLQEKNIELSRIQFYNDAKLDLEREVSASDASVTGGKVVLQNGQYINRITLDELTPGLLTGQKNGHLLISFEQGVKNSKAFHFAPVVGEKGEYFYQLVDEKGNSKYSRLEFEGLKYLVVHKKEKIRLMLAKEVIKEMKINNRIIKGNKIK